MPVKDQRVTVPIEATISRDTYEKLSPSQKLQLGAMASQFLDAYVNGGILVRPDVVNTIEKCCEKKINTDVQLLQEIQKATKRDEGYNVITSKIDEALMPAVLEHCRVIGWELKDVMDDIANRGVRDSLAFYVNNSSWEPVVYLTEKQALVFEKALGKKHFSGDDFEPKRKPVAVQELQEVKA
jgi:hypothetical protein